MKKIVALLFACFFVYSSAIAQTTQSSDETQPIVQDSIFVRELQEIVAVSTYKFSDDTARYYYNQMKYLMRTVYPYAVKAVALFNEIEQKASTLEGAARRRYIRSKEAEIKRAFESKLRNLNSTQGKYLVRMINRNAKMTCYEMISTLHNPVKASAWQAWARLNNIDLNEQYRPEVHKNFERIMRLLESGAN